MKRQRFRLKIVDHRSGAPDSTIETFDHPRAFLRALKSARTAAGHVSEQTVSVVHIYPHDKPELFRDPKTTS